MTDYYAAPVRDINGVKGVTTWVWADHDGLHCASDAPTQHVPTGHVWGWGPGVWVHWRDDAAAPPCGLVVKSQPFTGAQPATVTAYQGDDYPHVVKDRVRFLKAATADQERRLNAVGQLEVLALISPTHALLVGARSS